MFMHTWFSLFLLSSSLLLFLFLSACLRLYFFFFLMIRRPPRSTLFPTRRSSDLRRPRPPSPPRPAWRAGHNATCRSEEHTSELQSRGHLVCRLLLEKKKKQDRIKKAQIRRKHRDQAGKCETKRDAAITSSTTQ